MNRLQKFIAKSFGIKSATLRDPDEWFMDIMGRAESASGVRVSESAALGLSAYYAGVNMIAGTVASLPLNVFEKRGRRREVADRHPVQWLLHTEPNAMMSAMTLRQSWMLHIISHGNAYGLIIRGNMNEVLRINMITPDQIRPGLDENGQLRYEVEPWKDEKRYLDPIDVLHFSGMGYDGLRGYGLIQLAHESIGLNVAQEGYASRFFRNGGNISGIIQSEKLLNEQQYTRLKSQFAKKYQGLNNAHSVAILENNMKFSPVNPTHREAQLVEERRFTIDEWARWLNMPPHKLREMSKSSFNNIESQNIEWIVDTIMPWLKRFEQEFDRKLFPKRSQFYTKHVVDGQLRGDLKSRFEAYAIGRNWGWMSANDILALEDRNPLPGEDGDIYLIPMNMTTPEKMMTEPEPQEPAPVEPTEPTEPTEPVEPVVTDKFRDGAYERLLSFESRKVSAIGTAAYIEIYEKLKLWLFFNDKQAEKYCHLAKQLNLIAVENNVAVEETVSKKKELLQKIGDGHVKSD
jgi:HK97 family phage portal protein